MQKNYKIILVITIILTIGISSLALAKEDFENFDNTFNSPMFISNISYPFFTNQELNFKNHDFLNEIFNTNYQYAFTYFTEELEFIKSNLAKDQSLADNDRQFELMVTYELSQASDDLISILWNVYTYTGGAHGNIELFAHNYDLKENKKLSFNDIFTNQEEALKLLSELCPKYIQLKDYELDASGLSPVLENFSTITLYSDFIKVSFQAYQIAPWSAGLISCDIPIKELEKVINKKYISVVEQ